MFSSKNPYHYLAIFSIVIAVSYIVHLIPIMNTI